ncbi:spinster family MFS transporter [Elongatibacter sediminis]|uniref:MFS transporter n=1 Tax=Elongatibacter sediminis TaxID=3119006 RepID=A0AAW9RCE2_9GAMM
MTRSTAVRTPEVSLYSWYMVFLCTVAYVFSFVDRQVLALLVGPIRADLQLSDTQFSLLHGLAFAIFYAIMGLPIARLADTRSRPRIIAAGIVVWSIATSLCGVARNFWQLFFARMAVGAGEAALSPAAYSMITDSFPRSQLGFALGIYSLGTFIGSGLAYLIGGAAIEWVSHIGPIELPLVGAVKPWQLTFFVVGIPGVIIAALFVLTVRDPDRMGLAANDRDGFRISQVLGYIREHRAAFFTHYVGFGFLSLALFALLSWSPAFLIRSFGLGPKEVGVHLGLVVLIANTAGTLSSGWLMDRLTRLGYEDAALRSGVIGGLGLIVPVSTFALFEGLGGAVSMLALAMYFASFPVASSAAALQCMAPNRMRAQVTALFFLFMNLMGITGGATLVALCTDYIFQDDGSVGFSISIIAAVASILGVACLCWGLRYFRNTVREQAEVQ